MTALAKFIAAVVALIESLDDDEDRHGGLLSRDTLRHRDEVRSALSRLRPAAA